MNEQGTRLTGPERDRLQLLLFESAAAEMAQPLNLITVSQQYLQAHFARCGYAYSPEKVSGALNAIGCAAQQLNRLTANYLDACACLRDELQVHCDRIVDLGTLLRELCADSGAIEQATGIRLRMETDCTEALVRADPVLAERILLNLLSDALSGSVPGDLCRFCLRQQGEVLCLQVCIQPAAGAAQTAGAVPRSGIGSFLCGEYCRLQGWQMESGGAECTIRMPVPESAAGSVVFCSQAADTALARQMRRDALLQALRMIPGLEKLK